MVIIIIVFIVFIKLSLQDDTNNILEINESDNFNEFQELLSPVTFKDEICSYHYSKFNIDVVKGEGKKDNYNSKILFIIIYNIFV